MTIKQLVVKGAGPNAAGCRALFLIDEKYIQPPYPEKLPGTSIVIGELVMPSTVLFPDPEVLHISAPTEQTLAYTEEPLKEKGSNAKRYIISWVATKNNPMLSYWENTYFIPRRFVAIIIDNNGYPVLLGWVGAAGRVERTTNTGYDIGTDRNEVSFKYEVEMCEAAPFYTSNSGIDDDPFDIDFSSFL